MLRVLLKTKKTVTLSYLRAANLLMIQATSQIRTVCNIICGVLTTNFLVFFFFNITIILLMQNLTGIQDTIEYMKYTYYY